MNYAFEGQLQFLFEKRKETYKRYVDRASQNKTVSDLKSSLQNQSWIDLERRGA